MKKLMLVLALLGFVGCNPVCTVAQKIAGGLSDKVASQWQCKGAAQMKVDIEAALQNSVVCQQQGLQGNIADVLCPLAGQVIQDKIGQLPPATWQCDPKLVGVNMVNALVELCRKLPL